MAANKPGAAPRITQRDQALLAFAAEHRIVLASHLQALLGMSESAIRTRLRALSGAGFLRHETPIARAPRCYRITRKGLGAIGSDLPPPRTDSRSYRHDVGLGWVWVAARAGAFGPIERLLSERRMRSADAAAAHAGLLAAAGSYPNDTTPFAVRLGGTGPGGRQRLHYPDLLMIGKDGRRIAVELELTPKSRARRERILAGYAADAQIDAVLYLADSRSVARSIERTAARLAISDRVHVRRVMLGEQRTSESSGRVPARTHGRIQELATGPGRAREELGR